MILIDTNVLMYAAGADHANKRPSVTVLERVARGELDATIDAEVLQEILHRYRAIGRWDDGRRAYDVTRQLFPNVVPVTAAILDRARRVLDADGLIHARDALHAAVAMMEGMEGVLSFDRHFDRIKGIVRIEPA
jgi:predicted nucleic acid-binding protein